MRESRTLEYKENLSSNTFLKTISAYANYGEGKIIFGIIAVGAQVPLQAGEHRLFLPLRQGRNQGVVRILQSAVKERFQRFAGSGK